MFLKILHHEWLTLRRSSFWTQSVAQAIILAIFALYVILAFLSIGLFSDVFIAKYFPDLDLVKAFNGLIIYYFLSDIVIRFIFQKYAGFNLSGYITLNIKKSSICHFVMVKSLKSFFNIIPWFLILPFYVKNIAGQQLEFNGSLWLLLLLAFVLFNHFTGYWLNLSFGKKPVVAAGVLSLIMATIYLEFNGHISLIPHFTHFISYVASNGILVFLALCVPILLYLITYKFLRQNVYLELESNIKTEQISHLNFSIFRQFGDIGKWIELELKLILRNSRSKQYLYISFLFLLYPFVIGTKTENLASPGILLFSGLIVTGAFTLNYGQLLLSWNSSHFNFVLTQNMSIRNFIKAKYYLMVMSNAFFFLLSLPYGFIHTRIIFYFLIMALFNTGVTTFIYMFLQLHNARKIDISKRSIFNYEGFGAAHYLIMIPLIFLPMIIYWIFLALKIPSFGLLLIGISGVCGFIFHEKILDKAMDVFFIRKHIINHNFNK